jgi:hypothetical protein
VSVATRSSNPHPPACTALCNIAPHPAGRRGSVPDPCPYINGVSTSSATLLLPFSLRSESPDARTTSLHHRLHLSNSLTCVRAPTNDRVARAAAHAHPLLTFFRSAADVQLRQSALLLRPTVITLCDLIGRDSPNSQISSDFLSASIQPRSLRRHQAPFNSAESTLLAATA